VIDDRGRLFGKLNLIDAIVGIFFLLLIPLAYAAFLLFRVPQPKIASLTPSQIVEQQGGSVQIAGEDLRPFLMAKLGRTSADFFVQSPTRAELKVPADLPAGTYDLTLLDQGQVLFAKAGAVTVTAPAVQLDLQAAGAFVGLDKDNAVSIRAKSTFQTPGAAAPLVEVLAVRPPESRTSRVKIGTNLYATGALAEVRVPAIIRLHCAVLNGECRVAGTVATQNATITLPWATPASTGQVARSAAGQVRFVIDQLFPPGMGAEFPAIATVRVRFVGVPTILDAIKAGDADVSAAIDTERAVLTDLGSDRQAVTSLVSSEALLRVNLNVQQPMLAFTGTLRVPVVFTSMGWSYKDRPVKVGGSFTFESAAGAMSGLILDIKLQPEKSATTQ
jgi:hypothetical protein